MKRRYWFLLGSLLFVLLMGHLLISSILIDLSYKNTSQKVALDKLQSENRKRRVILARKEALSILEKKAKEMGMTPPGEVYYLLLPTKEVDTR